MSINYGNIARSIARQSWGDVNSTYKTNQKFCYYFSCSGHGGYVIAYDMLTDKQKEILVRWYGSEDKIYFIKAASDSEYGSYKLNATYRETDSRYKNLRFIQFEEDCEYAIPEGLLGISCVDKPQRALETLRKWYPEDMERFEKSH